MQVELAQLNYLMPRLRSKNSFQGLVVVKAQEDQVNKLETDRRHIRRRVDF